MGLTTPDHPTEEMPNGLPLAEGSDPAPDPEIETSDLDLLEAYVGFLAQPARRTLDSPEDQAASQEGEELFDDEFPEDDFGDELDDFLVDEEPMEEEFGEEAPEEESIDLGYAVRLSAASPAFVHNTLMTWNSLIDVRFGADLPFTFRLGPIRMRIGAEVVTYKFINYLPEGGEFSGVGVYGMVTFPAGPSDMHGGVGFLGSAPAVVVGQSFGIPYADNIIFKMGTRATLTLTAPEQLKEIGPRATWFEGFFTVVYSLDL